MRRYIVALFVALFFAWLAAYVNGFGALATDFSWPYYGVQRLLDGQNPYAGPFPELLASDHPYRSDPLFYPAPALLVVLPFAFLPYAWALPLFAGWSAGLLAFLLTRRSWWPLLLFATPQAFIALRTGQWSPLLLVAYLLPSWGVLYACKPSLAIPLWLSRPSLRSALLAAAAMLLTLPWLSDWLNNLRLSHHPSPVYLLPFGPFLLLAALRWRDPRARLLLVWSLVPSFPYFYDALPLLLVARNVIQLQLLVVFSWVALFLHQAGYVGGIWFQLAIYIPPVLLVLVGNKLPS